MNIAARHWIGDTCRAMAQTKPASSRAIAVVTTFGGFLASASLEPIRKEIESQESVVIPWLAPESMTRGAEMWTPEHRRAAERSGLRYPSDLSDAEWRWWCR